jgi:threonine synthase
VMRTINVSASYSFKDRESVLTLSDGETTLKTKVLKLCTRDLALFIGLSYALDIQQEQEDYARICCDSWDAVIKAKAADCGIFLPEDHPNFDELSEEIIQAEMLFDSLSPKERTELITKC